MEEEQKQISIEEAAITLTMYKQNYPKKKNRDLMSF